MPVESAGVSVHIHVPRIFIDLFPTHRHHCQTHTARPTFHYSSASQITWHVASLYIPQTNGFCIKSHRSKAAISFRFSCRKNPIANLPTFKHIADIALQHASFIITSFRSSGVARNSCLNHLTNIP